MKLAFTTTAMMISSILVFIMTTVAIPSGVNGLSFTTCGSSSKTSFLSSSTTLIHHTISTSSNNFLTMKVSKGRSKSSRSKGSTIAVANDKRVSAAGRRGTKNFLDPTKVFVGNLSYQATEADVKEFLHVNGVNNANLVSVKVIRDWKTNQSKGYGFVQFMEPIYATSAMELVRGKRLQGRVVRLDQGKRKKADPVILVKKTRDAPIDTEESVIEQALADAEANDAESEAVLEDGFYLDDTTEDYDDALLFADVDDDDEDEDEDFQYDGVYIEEFLDDDDDDDEDSPVNREQRREAAKKKKRRRKPGNGFNVNVSNDSATSTSSSSSTPSQQPQPM